MPPIPAQFHDPGACWTHFAGLGLSVIGATMLVEKTRHDPGKRLTMLIYGGTMVLAFGASGLYHAVNLAEDQRLLFRKIDHAAIYLFIAGTNTPIHYNLFTGARRWALLLPLWLMAAAGAAAKFLWFDISYADSVMLYLAMGWLGVMGFVWSKRVLPPGSRRLIIQGGSFYTIGAVIDCAGWFGRDASHVVFHVFVILGSLMFWLFIRFHVVPFPRRCRL